MTVRRRCRWLVGVLLGLLLTVATPASAQDLLVFGAASLKEALERVIDAYREAGGGPARAAFGASSTLARQIEQGAPADVFVSANPAWMDYLDERRLIRAGSRTDLLGNALVLVAPTGAAVTLDIAAGFDLDGALGDGRLAMGDPDHVPAGIYARAALDSLGAWDAVSPRVARADNVRAALALVARAETPLGIVYRSDAQAAAGVQVVGVFPPETHPSIIYPVAIVAESKHPEAAALVDFLGSDGAATMFEDLGFTALD